MAIVKTLSTVEAATEAARRNKWPYEAAKVLVEYLEELSKGTGQHIEFDPIAWRCEWAYYETAEEAEADYGCSMEELKAQTMVLETPAGLFVATL